jgi:protein TonB
VKRILIAAILALGIHAMLLGTEFRWIKRSSADRPQPKVLTLSLALPQRQAPIQKIAKKKPQIPFQSPDPPTPVKKKLKKNIPKPKPTDSVQTPHPSPVLEQPAAAIQPYVDNLESLSKSQPLESNTISDSIEQSLRDYRVVDFIRKAKPLYRSNPSPGYPRMARRRGYQGNVVLEVMVARNGTVSDLRVFKSSGFPILDRAALDSVKKWTFVPGMRGDEIVEMWVKVPIRFELK